MSVEEMARKLGLTSEELIHESIRTFLEEKIRFSRTEQSEILRRYEVKSLKELETKIKDGIIPEHPAWEDLINLENSLAYQKRLGEMLHIVKTRRLDVP